jgi:hypothetical protein
MDPEAVGHQDHADHQQEAQGQRDHAGLLLMKLASGSAASSMTTDR